MVSPEIASLAPEASLGLIMVGLAFSKIRFFTAEQRKEHDEAVGHQCEWEVDKFERCPKTDGLQADHVDPFYKGGETEEENMLWLCKEHHVLKHLADGENWILKYFGGKQG